MNHYLKSLLLFIIVLGFSACEENDEPDYNIPSTYNFSNVSYSGQTQRLAMLNEMKIYMATTQQSSVSIDADRLKAMFANADGAGFQGTFDTSKELKGKTFEAVTGDFEALMDELAFASQSTSSGSEGISGVIKSTSNDAKQYLIGGDGLDHAQIIEKGLMGACLYYQATAVYMGEGKMNVDNEVVTEGEGTEMEHHWDEAFGYLGVPIDFPTSKENLAFWGNYVDKRESVLGSSSKIMDAMLKGRAAISNNDLEARDEAITEARALWEEVAVGSALHYLNEGIANFEDMALRGHGLSEAIGFIFSLQFNPSKKIDNTQVANLLNTFAGASSFDQMNLYNTSIENITTARDQLATYYNLEDRKEDF